MHAIMRYATDEIILDVPNQLFFSYKDLVPKLFSFIVLLVELIKALKFILQLEEKRKAKMLGRLIFLSFPKIHISVFATVANSSLCFLILSLALAPTS